MREQNCGHLNMKARKSTEQRGKGNIIRFLWLSYHLCLVETQMRKWAIRGNLASGLGISLGKSRPR